MNGYTCSFTFFANQSESFTSEIERIVFCPNEPSNDPQLVVTMIDKDDSLGEISIWETGTMLFEIHSVDGNSDTTYKREVHSYLEIEKLSFDFSHKLSGEEV